MQRIRQHFLSRFFCGLVAAIILNFSVDVPDLHDDSVPEDLSYNDIESVAEWVCEDVLDIENAFSEHDEDDESHPLKVEKTVQLFFERPTALLYIKHPIVETFEAKHNLGYTNFYSHNALDELIQPPEA